MRLIDQGQAERLLDYPGLIEALDQAHKLPPPMVEKSLLMRDGGAGPQDSFLVWSAWSVDEFFGVKMAVSLPEKADGPSIHSVYQLFDGATGAPLATIDAGPLTARKTAADSALGARYLARADVEHMVMVGAGGQARALIEGHMAVRPSLTAVTIWNRTHHRADTLAASLKRAHPTVAFEVADELEPAIRRADLISCATRSFQPLVFGAWLRPGTHLDLVGGYTPDMHEADLEAARIASIFVDSRWFATNDVGDIQSAIEAGVIDLDDIKGDLFDLSGGSVPGRRDEAEITLFKNGGGGHLDLFTAAYLWRQISD